MNALPAAQYLLRVLGAKEAMTVHRLLYLCQVRHLALHARRLFDDEIEAWTYGPVAPSFFAASAGLYLVKAAVLADVEELVGEDALSTCSRVAGAFGQLRGQELSDRVDSDRAMVEARSRSCAANLFRPVLDDACMAESFRQHTTSRLSNT